MKIWQLMDDEYSLGTEYGNHENNWGSSTNKTRKPCDVRFIWRHFLAAAFQSVNGSQVVVSNQDMWTIVNSRFSSPCILHWMSTESTISLFSKLLHALMPNDRDPPMWATTCYEIPDWWIFFLKWRGFRSMVASNRKQWWN